MNFWTKFRLILHVSGDREVGRWGTRGPRSPKGVGIRGGGGMGGGGEGCGECVDAVAVRGSQSWTPRTTTLGTPRSGSAFRHVDAEQLKVMVCEPP